MSVSHHAFVSYGVPIAEDARFVEWLDETDHEYELPDHPLLTIEKLNPMSSDGPVFVYVSESFRDLSEYGGECQLVRCGLVDQEWDAVLRTFLFQSGFTPAGSRDWYGVSDFR